MNIIKHNITLNNRNLVFFAPENDSVVPGTIASMQNDNWKIKDIKFNDGDIFVDFGCSVGIVSMVFAALYPNIKVFSFDANPVAIKCLQMAINENGLRNINVFNLAIGTENKKDVEFLTYNENETCLIQKNLCTNERLKSYKCDMVSVENFFDNYIPKFQNIKYLKVDIETGEFALFDYLFDKRPDILDKIEYLQLEIHPCDDSNPKSKRLKEMVINKFNNRVIL
jgi:FkbM family methyltransferase